MTQPDVDIEYAKKRIAELEAEIERDRPREIEEIELSSAENVLREIIAAYDRALDIDRTKVLRAYTPRMSAALNAARKFIEDN